MSDRLTICPGTCGETREHWHLQDGSMVSFAPMGDSEPLQSASVEALAVDDLRPPAERAVVLGLLHWCDACPDTPEERAAVEAHEREVRKLPTLHRAPEPPFVVETRDDSNDTYDCDGCGKPTPRDELHHYEGGALPEGWFCETCTTEPSGR